MLRRYIVTGQPQEFRARLAFEYIGLRPPHFFDPFAAVGVDVNSTAAATNKNGLGQLLYVEAKKMIPGGTQLLSKRPEMFLPDQWPAYYQHASGIEVSTLDGIRLQDFSLMGVGACILGYADEDVNREVHKAVDRGNMCTLNCPSEVELTKLLLELHPWAGMCR
eukprot:g6986.t1